MGNSSNQGSEYFVWGRNEWSLVNYGVQVYYLQTPCSTVVETEMVFVPLFIDDFNRNSFFYNSIFEFDDPLYCYYVIMYHVIMYPCVLVKTRSELVPSSSNLECNANAVRDMYRRIRVDRSTFVPFLPFLFLLLTYRQ